MNILVIAKLSSEKLLSKLRPFVDNPQIVHIYLLRDDTFETGNKKIEFLPISKNKGTLRHIEKLWIARQFAKKHQIDIVLSYLLPPHGYIGWILSKVIIKSKWIHAIIAGHREIWMNGKLVMRINLLILGAADMISVMGKATRNYLICHGIDDHKIVVIPNAIDGELFQPPTIKSVFYDIVYASRIDENKNFPLLIRAVERLKTEFPKISICVAGDGDKLDEAKRLCHQKRLDENFLFLGKLDHCHIKDIYYQSWIFVLSSRGEGVPMSLLEAMFCGLACISTNVGEIGSIIQDGVNGFLIPDTEDDRLLSERIRELLTNEKLRTHISHNATNIRDYYSFAYVTRLWNKVLSDLFE